MNVESPVWGVVGCASEAPLEAPASRGAECSAAHLNRDRSHFSSESFVCASRGNLDGLGGRFELSHGSLNCEAAASDSLVHAADSQRPLPDSNMWSAPHPPILIHHALLLLRAPPI